MNKEKSNLPEYDGVDEKGYYSLSEFGKFRSLTVEDGVLRCLRPYFRIRPKDEGGEVNYDLRTKRFDRGNEGRHNRRNS